MGRSFEMEELKRFFQPVTSQTRELSKKVGELPERIAKSMPKQRQEQRQQPILDDLPPPYEAPFAEEDVIIEEEEEKESGIQYPKEITYSEDSGYMIGDIPFVFDHKKKRNLY